MRESVVYRPKIGVGMKKRYARIKLLSGGYISANGRPQSYAGPAAIFRYEDAMQFLRDIAVERSDYLWGASIEMLAKRKSWAEKAVTEEQFKKMLATVILVRLESQAAMFERLADSAQATAKHNLEQAVRYRMKAAEVRERLTTEKA